MRSTPGWKVKPGANAPSYYKGLYFGEVKDLNILGSGSLQPFAN